MATIEERPGQDGQTHYRVRIRLRGLPSREATFHRKTDAKRWAIQTEAELHQARHFPDEVAETHTVGEMIDRYIEDVLPMKPKLQGLQTTQLAWWRAQLGPVKLADIRPHHIVACRDALARGKTRRGTRRAPGTVNRYLTALGPVFTTAVTEWAWLKDSPMHRVKLLKEPRGRVRYLSDMERERLLEICQEHANPVLYPAVIIALTTGMRRGELMTLKWGDVDLKRRQVVLHHTKNGERRTVPLVGPALTALEGMMDGRPDYGALIFPGKVDRAKPMDLTKPFKTCLKHAGIEDFRWHDLRHSAASYLAMSGATPSEIAAVLGHKTLDMVKRYAHLSDAHTMGVVERMAAKFLS